MSHRVKSNGTVKDLAELQELDAVKTIAHAVYTAGLNAVDFKFNASAAQDGALLGSLDIISCNCKHQALDPWHRSEIFLKR